MIVSRWSPLVRWSPRTPAARRRAVVSVKRVDIPMWRSWVRISWLMLVELDLAPVAASAARLARSVRLARSSVR